MDVIQKKMITDEIAFMGDLHVGVDNFIEHKARKARDRILDEGKHIMFMGDLAEYRPPGHKFYTPNSMTLDEQLDYVFDLMAPFVKDKMLLGVLEGNHEAGLNNATTINPIRRWCKDHEVPYVQGMAVFDLSKDGYNYKYLVSHGHGGGGKLGSHVNRIGDFVTRHGVDACVMGHSHRLATWTETELEYNNGTIQHTYKKCGISGSFYLTYKEGATSYGEKKGFSPLPVGWLESRVGKGEITFITHEM